MRSPAKPLAIAVVVLASSPVLAWNGLGHKVVADIAWQQLTPQTRERIVMTLRRNPDYDEHFAKELPADVDDERWTFQQAGVWPDLIRNDKRYDHPTWHYVDYAVFLGPVRPVPFNQATEIDEHPENWNVMQAVAYNRRVIADEQAPLPDKAIAYCWLIHLAGDLHQPLHSSALVCDRFPHGDKGGNAIKVVQRGNLHSLWDGLMGEGKRPADVVKVVAELKADADAWKVDATIDVPAMVQESHAVCKTSVYTADILGPVSGSEPDLVVDLPEFYLKNAGLVARRRAVAAGLRLAKLLSE